jgi:hypothetical protein
MAIETFTPDDTPDEGVTNSMLGRYFSRILIGKYSRPTPFDTGSWTISKRIDLPLPDILQDNTSVKYNGVELESVADFINGGLFGGAAGLVARNVGTAGNSILSKGAGSLAGAVAERFGASGELSNVIGGAVTQGVSTAFPADKLQTAFEQIARAAPNPNPSVAFQGPNLREFQLTWTFFPTSKEESDNIHNIIKILKIASLPRNTVRNSGAILDYPDMCQLNFFPWDNTSVGQESPASEWFWSPDSIIKLKRCVMNNVSVDYNVSNIPGFFAGNKKPVSVRLSIGFSEIEYMLSNDWGGPESKSGLIKGAIDAATAVVTGTGLALNPLGTNLFGTEVI